MRLLKTPPADPAWNLALDEALLRRGAPTLRLYSWDPPGYSLGYFQKRGDHAVPEGYACVRRPTGGGAIAHVGELTLSWIGARRRVEEAYAVVNAAVARALSSFDVPVRPGEGRPEAAPRGLCFDAHTRYDLLAARGKIFGSAQRRGKDAFLLHGTLVLEPNPVCAGAVSLEEVAGAVSRADVERAIVDAWEEPLEEGALTPDEERAAAELRETRYGDPRWTNRR